MMTNAIDMQIGTERFVRMHHLVGGVGEGTKADAVESVGGAAVERHFECRFLAGVARRRSLGANWRRIWSSFSSTTLSSSSGRSVITRAYSASTAALARTSPCNAFAISDLIKARCLLTRRDLPSSRTVICSFSSAARSVASFRLPLGRPFGLPDFPRLNWPDFGGLPYPTLYSLIAGSLSAGIGSDAAKRGRARPAL